MVAPPRLTIALLALASPASAQTAVQVSVDATAPGAPLERVWPFFGFDEINYATTPEGQDLLATLATSNTAPVHVRNHFLFNNGDGVPALKWGSTNVYTEDAAGAPVYSWTLTDGIMDAITGAGAFPLVELGFMPQALSPQPTPYRNSSPTLLDGGSYFPPTDHAKWGALIRTWAGHANERYPDVSARWLWELWNEPDLGYWNGTVTDYTELYDVTEAALHQVLPDAPLGGPAVAGPGGSFLTQFLRHCATGTNAVTGQPGTRLDLVTFHAKGGVAVAGDHVQMNLGAQLKIHRAGFNAIAAFPQFKQTPIYITEADPDGCAACPASETPADAYRTSPAYGAYEIAMMKRTLELEAQLGVRLGGVLTWAFAFPGTPYFAGYRVLRSNGIDLPVLAAFKLLGRLQGARLPVESSGAAPLDDLLSNGVRVAPDVDAMATQDGDTVQILVWSYHDDLQAAAPAMVRLTTHLPATFGGYARITHLRVDDAHGNSYAAWTAQGRPANPTPDQLASLRAAMIPTALAPEKIVAVAPDGSVALDFEIPRFGVSLITVIPTPAPATGCACRAPHPAGLPMRTGLFLMGALFAPALWRRRQTRAAKKSRLINRPQSFLTTSHDHRQ